ncbi:MAG: CDP-alcohol phosphatidyltransferase family protein [Bacteroidota bacterium]
MKRLIPSIITLLNLACGAAAILIAIGETAIGGNRHWWVAGLMVLAMLADFADGLVARLLKVTSEIGAQLDSLADMVTFGLLPGILVYQVLFLQLTANDPGTGNNHLAYWPWLGLIIPLFSAYRLAKFNVDTRQTTHFRGFPTPPNAFLFLSIYLLFAEDWAPLGFHPDQLRTAWTPVELIDLSFIYQPIPLSIITVVMSLLLVSNVPLLSSKMSNYRLQNNWVLYGLVGISLVLLAIMWYKAVPLIIVLYFIASFIDRISRRT